MATLTTSSALHGRCKSGVVKGDLQNATGPYGQLTYSYDGVGNRTQESTTIGSTTNTAVTGYSTTSNQMSQVTTNGTVTRSYGYDGAGNLTTDTSGGVTTTYAYNNAGRLATATAGTSLKGTYTYDGLKGSAFEWSATPRRPARRI